MKKKFPLLNLLITEKKEDFISDFRKIDCYGPNFGSRIDCVVGEAIQIIYPNGDIELITSYGPSIVKDGQIRTKTTTFDSDAFGELLKKYS